MSDPEPMINSQEFTAQKGLRQKSITKHCRMGLATQLVLVLATGTTLVVGGTTVQAQQVWDTTGPDDQWNTTALNWDAGATFTPGNDALFGVTGETVDIDEAGGIQVGGMTFDVSGYVITGTPLDVTGTVTVTNDGDEATISAEIQNGLTINGDGTVNVQGIVGGNIAIAGPGSDANISSTAIAGSVDVSGTGVVAFVDTFGPIVVQDELTQSDGTVNINGVTTFSDGAGTDSSVISGGTLNINSDTDFNDSTLDVQAGATYDQNAQVTGNVTLATAAGDIAGDIVGTLDVTGGLTNITESVTISDDVTVSGGELDVNSGYTLTASTGVDVFGGTFDVNGEVVGDVVVGEPSGAGTLDLGGVITGNVDHNVGQVTVDDVSTITGTFDVAADADVNSNLAVNGQTTVENGGDLEVDANLTGNVDVDLGGTLDIDDTVTGNVMNDGLVELGGTITGNVDNNADFDVLGVSTITGTLDTSGDMDVTANLAVNGQTTVENGGDLEVDANLTGNVDVDLGGTLDIDDTVTGNVMNDGLVELGGTITGNVDNNADFDVLGVSTITGTLDTSGDMDVTANLAVNGQTTVENGGDLEVDANLTGNVDVDLGGTLDIDDTVTGNVMNDGLVELGGTITGNVDNNADFDVLGVSTITGTLDTSGDMDVTANLAVNGQTTVENGGDLEVDANLTGNVDVDLGGTLDIDDTVTGNVMNDGLVELGGTITGNVDNNADFDVLGVSTITGTLDTSGDMDVTANLAVNGQTTVENGGDLEVDANLTGNVDVDLGGTLDIDDTVTGNVMNDGLVELGGTITGNVDNNADFDVLGVSTITGTLDTSGDMDVTANLAVNGQTTVENGGDLEVDANLTGNVDVDLGGTLDIDDTVTGNVMNDGLVELGGTITGNVDNNADFDVLGVSTITGTLDTSGDMDVTANLAVNGQTTVENGGDLEVDANLTGNVDVDLGGTLDIDDTVTGNVMNDGLVELGGTITGNLDTNETLSIDGISTITGVFDNSGNATAEAQLSWGTATNSGTFTIDPTVTVGTAGGLLTNTGTLELNDGSTIASGVQNDGDLDVSGTGNLVAGLTGTGDVNMLDGATDDILNITGDVNATGLTFNLDADLSDAATGVDNIAITGGGLQGDFVLSFTDIGPGNGTLLGAPINVLTYDIGEINMFDYTVTGLGAVGSTIYFIDDSTDGFLQLASLSDPNLGGLAGAVVLTQSILGSIVNRPSSPYVVGLAIPGDDPCGPGVWGRQVGGQADASATITSELGGIARSLPSEVSASYAGFQFGLDMNCSGGYYNGWDLSYGGIIGYNEGNTVQPVFNVDAMGEVITSDIRSFNNTDFSQTYGGAYVSAFKDGLLLDLQYRIEDTSFDLDNTALNAIDSGGIVDQTFGSQTQTLGGSASYQFNLNEEMRLNLTPTIGFSFSETSVDSIRTIDGPLEIDDFSSRIGFVGATLSRTLVDPGGDYANTFFGTVTYYDDFADDIEATTALGSSIQTPNLGGFTELSLGMNYIQLLDGSSYMGARQLNASVRVDGKFSENVNAWGITGQVRFDF